MTKKEQLTALANGDKTALTALNNVQTFLSAFKSEKVIWNEGNRDFLRQFYKENTSELI